VSRGPRSPRGHRRAATAQRQGGQKVPVGRRTEQLLIVRAGAFGPSPDSPWHWAQSSRKSPLPCSGFPALAPGGRKSGLGAVRMNATTSLTSAMTSFFPARDWRVQPNIGVCSRPRAMDSTKNPSGAALRKSLFKMAGPRSPPRTFRGNGCRDCRRVNPPGLYHHARAFAIRYGPGSAGIPARRREDPRAPGRSDDSRPASRCWICPS